MTPHPSHPTDDLVQRARLVRGLVRALVSDGTDAEDVEQQVWLAAVQKPPGAGYSWKPWVVGVVRHLRATLARERARRDRRELAAAREEAQPSTLDVNARLEGTRRLLEALDGLGEPWRTTLTLRFLDDLPPRTIARRMGVPVATVRTRVRTGLQQLRDRLAGWRRDWLGALVPLCGTGPAQGIGGALLMGTKTKALAALAAGMLLLGWWAWPSAVQEMLPDEPGASTSVAAASVAEPQSAPRDAVAESRASERPATSSAWVVRGHVLRESGEAVPRATVRAEVFLGAVAAGAPASSERLQATDAGAFAWPASAPRGPATLRLLAHQERHAGAACTVRVFPGDTPPADLSLLLEPLEAEVTGTVVGANGAPLAGAKVRLAGSPFDLETTSDAAGRFVIALPAGARDGVLHALAPGHALGVARLGAGTRPGAPADFCLRREAVVRGRIADARGAPVAGADVESCATPELRATSAADGAYALANLEPTAAGPVRLRIRAAGFVPQEAEIELSDLAITRDFVLERGDVVRGTVADEHGGPLQGASVLLAPESPGGAEVRVFTGADGAFTIEGVPAGARRLLVQRRGQAPLEVRVPRAGGEPLTLRMERPGVLRGTVVDRSNQPVAGVRLGFLSRSADASRYDLGAVSDGAGRFEFEGLPRAGATVELVKPGYHTAKVDVPGEGKGLVLVVERCGVLAGRVVDAVTREPLARFRIRVFAAELGAARELAFEAGDGRWETRAERMPLHAGTFARVEAWAEGHAPEHVEHVPVSEEPRHDLCLLALTRGSTVRGRVLEEDGHAPLPEALVTVLQGDADVAQVRTDALGAFELAGVASGSTRLRVEHPSWPVCVDGPFTVGEPGSAVDRTITLSRGASLAGTVLDLFGAPVPNAALLLCPVITEPDPAARRRRGPRESWISVRADQSGSYRITKLRPGPYVLAQIDRRTERTGGEAFRMPVEVGTAATKLDLDPRCGTGTARVSRSSLRAPTTLDISQAFLQVTELPPEGEAPSGETMRAWGCWTSNGVAEVRGLPPGKYFTLEYVARQGNRPRIFEVGAGATVEVRLLAGPTR